MSFQTLDWANNFAQAKNSAHNVGAFANPQRVILYTFQTLPYPVKCLAINTLASSAASVKDNRF